MGRRNLQSFPAYIRTPNRSGESNKQVKQKVGISVGLVNGQHIHRFNDHFPGESRLAGLPLEFPSPFIPRLCFAMA